MPNSTPIPKIAWALGAATLLASAAAVFADTTVQAPVTSGASGDNALRIGQGCGIPWGDTLPVVAQSVVFPSSAPVITGSDGKPIADLSAVIVPASLVGLAKPVQNDGIFASQQLKTDALGNVIGWSSTGGNLTLDFRGRAPFQFAAPAFVASSCAKRLLVKVAVADICELPGSGDGVLAGKVNLWIPDNGSGFATKGRSRAIEGVGAPATLIINRDLVATPLAPACGAGIDVTVTPSAADVDANLPIPGIWGVSAGSGVTATPVPLVEFYNASLDHYFITWVNAEIAILNEKDAIQGWAMTGKTWRTFNVAQPGTSPVCRFYIPPALGNSHFFGRGTAECNATAQKNPTFVLEDPAFMQMFLPIAGVCATNTVPVYRVFSNRPDANHRYMTDKATRDQMVAKGWLAEGDGPDLVVMCAPQ